MERRKLVVPTLSKYMQEKLNLEKQHKEEGSKVIGDYLLSLTNICFDKCVSTDLIYSSSYENKCIERCFYTFSESYNYIYTKMNNVYKPYNISRGYDYIDLLSLTESVKLSELSKFYTLNK